MAEIVIVGSMNMDFVVNCYRLPEPGETISGKSFTRHSGGKGANQAAAAGLLGASPLFIGARGADDIGQTLEDNLNRQGVKTELITTDIETGTAHIFVTDDGENHITIIPGANGTLDSGDICSVAERIKDAEILLFQLEIPLEAVTEAARLAAEAGTTVILDPAPAQKLPDELLNRVDYLLPNKNELERLTGTTEIEEGCSQLLKRGVKNIILTLGGNGAVLANDKGIKNFTAPEIDVVDTTAAGDALAGAFAVALNKGFGLEEAIREGIYYGSAAVSRPGAQSSLFTSEEFAEFLSSRSE
ncbi:ribokinase [Halarsenatibacter silvermanii]|uniref:Ribokinase n=1 Tax=Halarsenatibacter silvermanii TaxID=321763 RepID=A0A1G9S3L8_9FIRM|nr:ribokinase [Halarsenatibacter silvermanii]SDM29870.1 ribokinase [Halarsenatibacter silvermanii]